MKQPLLIVAGLFVSGILVSDFLSAPILVLLPGTCVLACLALFVGRLRPALLFAAVFLAGWCDHAIRTTVLSPVDLRRIAAGEAIYATVRATVVEAPTHRIRPNPTGEEWRSQLLLNVSALRREDAGWEPAYGRVVASTPGRLGDQFHLGRAIEVTGVLQSPPPAFADGMFDYRRHLQRRGVYHVLRASTTNDFRPDARPAGAASPFAPRFLAWAQRSMSLGLPVEDEALRLQWAMALGWKTALTEEVSEPFMRSGTMHIFAISGLHIALITTILASLLRVLQLPRALCGTIIVPLIWFYTAATGWQSSAIRSTVMSSVVVIGWALQRPSNLLNSLAASALIILTWDPQQLFQASFQLSFFVVLSIALLLPPIEGIRQRWLQGDPFLPPELRPGWRRHLDTPLRWVTVNFATSLAAWLGSVPLVAGYFHLLTPVSLLANLLIVPMSGLALMSALGTLLTASWLPGVASLFNHSGWFWMTCMVRASEWCAALPGGFVYVKSPPAWLTAGYYLLLLALAGGWFRLPRKRLIAWSGLLLIVAAGIAGWLRDRGTVTLHVLPLDGGQAIFLDNPGTADDWLIDAGNRSKGESIVIPFLRAHGVNRLSHLALTHGDAQHIGGAESVIAETAPRHIHVPDTPFRSPGFRQITSKWGTDTDRWHSVSAGQQLGSWTVLHPRAGGDFAQADDATLVLAGMFNGVRVILLPDLGAIGQQDLLRPPGPGRGDVVISSPTTRGEPLRDDLLDILSPTLTVIVDADYPATARASQQLRQRLRDRGPPALFTRETGALMLEFRGGRYRVRTFGDAPADLSTNEISAQPARSPAPD